MTGVICTLKIERKIIKFLKKNIKKGGQIIMICILLWVLNSLYFLDKNIMIFCILLGELNFLYFLEENIKLIIVLKGNQPTIWQTGQIYVWQNSITNYNRQRNSIIWQKFGCSPWELCGLFCLCLNQNSFLNIQRNRQI